MDKSETPPAAPAPAPAPAPASDAKLPDLPPTEAEWQSFLDQAALWAANFIDAFFRPLWLVQAAVIVVCYVAAYFAARALTPPFEERLRRIEAQPRLLRVLVVPLRRLKWLIFALALWLSAALMKQVTWASRSYYIGIAATLVAAWVVISVTSRFIRNRTVANIFAVSAWSIVALSIVGALDDVVIMLDRAAIPIGDFRLSLLVVVKGTLLLAALIWLATIVSEFIDRWLRQSEDLAPALQVLLGKAVKFILITAAFLMTLSAVGINLTALTVFSGALGLGIGFGLQNVASNLISGIIILMDRSIKPGDVISLEETFGWINSLKARYVSVITRDGVEYLIPNETFVSHQVVNWSYSSRNVRQDVKFGVSYDCNPHEVRKIAVEAVSSIDRVLETPVPVCHLTGFGDSSLDFILRFWIRDPVNGLTNIKGAVFLSLWDAFQEHGIEIPYPHTELLLPRPVRVESVTAGARSARAATPSRRGQAAPGAQEEQNGD